MLYYAAAPVGQWVLELCVSPFWPETDYLMDQEAYREWLRALWRRGRHPFMALARDARDRDSTLLCRTRLDLLVVWCDAIVQVGAVRGWQIAGGALLTGALPTHGRYVP